MNDKIKITYEGTDYTLEYTRDTVRLMEANGFMVNELTTKPMLMLPMAFEGAFLKNHRNVKKKVIDKIYDIIPDKEKLIETLADMISETYESLMNGNEEEKDSGNISWEVVSTKKQAK